MIYDAPTIQMGSDKRLTKSFKRAFLGRVFFFFQLEFTPCKAEQPLQGMEL